MADQDSSYDSFKFKNPKTGSYDSYPTDNPGLGSGLIEHAKVGDYNKPELDAARQAAQARRKAATGK